jgi:diguanylate cyclase (GGDEF)-like protein
MTTMTDSNGTVIPFTGQPEPDRVPADMLLDATRDLGEATYSWNVESDVMTWGLEATHIFGVREMAALSTGTAFATLIDQASPHSRHSEVFESDRRDQGTGVTFTTRYLVNPAPGLRFWVEDSGRWFADPHGRPRLVHGVCRRVLAPSSEELALVTKRHFDPTTGALTRADFCNALGDAIVTNARDSRGIVLMMVAVDDLAQLNKSYGYHIGDEIIAAMVRRLRGLIRRRDILGRYATNKIGIVLAPSIAEHMEFVANRLASAIRGAPVETSAGPISATVHIGGVAVPRDAKNAIEALHACEEALTDAKDQNDSAFLAFSSDPETRTQRSSNRESTESVLSALNDRRIELAFQPIVHSATGEVALYESLVRMMTPEGELMGASAIVPVAERLGFLHLIDHRVMELALETLRLRRDIQLTVNVGVDTALHPDWMAAFRAHLSIDTSVAQRLVVEITETSLIEDVKAAQALIETIKDCGARVAIDDFGAGHTSFAAYRHSEDRRNLHQESGPLGG